MKPTEINEFLEHDVIGQEEALRFVAVAIFKHLQGERFGNLMLIGNSGTGKTTIMNNIQRMYHDVPEYRPFRAMTILNANLLVDAERMEFQPERLFAAVRELDPEVEITCHFHNTYGLGMANILAALRSGVTSFETSFAGLGGCPFTRVAAGNVATEDFVHALQLQGLREEVDLDQLIGVACGVAEYFGREMPGCVYKTGTILKKEAA